MSPWTVQLAGLARHLEQEARIAGMHRGAALEFMEWQRVRREILTLLEQTPSGMTTAQMAEAILMSPKSARGHLGRLKIDGLVELKTAKGPWIWKITKKGIGS